MSIKYTLEFDMKGSPPGLIWKYISTPQGLAQWFADDVSQSGKTLTFHWKGGGNDAEIIGSRASMYVRMKWLDDDNPRSYFEMRIASSELTSGTTLIVTDFADDEDEKASTTHLWEHQITELRRIIGCK